MRGKHRFIAALLFVCAGLCAARPALAISEAGEAYVAPSYFELIQTIILLGGLDVQNTKILDEYIKMTYCDLYKANHKDDFAWNAIEKQIRDKIVSKREYSRSLYQLVGLVELGTYDAARQRFPFAGTTRFENVGSMMLTDETSRLPYCVEESVKKENRKPSPFPKNIDLVLPQPFSLVSYKVPKEEAEKILDRMHKLKIDDRKLYIRFRFHVQALSFNASTHRAANSFHLDGEIVDVDLFYDRDLTQWVGDVSLK